eukprot:1666906-Pyramimonas_sp.AAC.1
MQINPPYRPCTDDGSDPYVAVQCNAKRTAVHADNEARSRQIVRNALLGEPALSYQSGEKYLRVILNEANIKTAVLDDQDRRECPEWLTTATRHKPFHLDQLSG